MPRYCLLLLGALLLQACNSQPQDAPGFVKQADRFLAQGDTSKAIASYRQALDRDSLNPDILARLGRVYAAQGKSGPADTYLRRSADLTYQSGLKALADGNQTAAVLAFEHTVQVIPAHPLALIRLGELFLSKGQEDSALVYFEKATLANHEYPESFIKLGKLYLSRQRQQEAQAAFEHAIELDINAKEAYLGLGQLATLQQNWRLAAEQYRKVLLIDPKSTIASEALDKLGPKL